MPIDGQLPPDYHPDLITIPEICEDIISVEDWENPGTEGYTTWGGEYNGLEFANILGDKYMFFNTRNHLKIRKLEKPEDCIGQFGVPKPDGGWLYTLELNGKDGEIDNDIKTDLPRTSGWDHIGDVDIINNQEGSVLIILPLEYEKKDYYPAVAVYRYSPGRSPEYVGADVLTHQWLGNNKLAWAAILPSEHNPSADSNTNLFFTSDNEHVNSLNVYDITFYKSSIDIKFVDYFDIQTKQHEAQGGDISASGLLVIASQSHHALKVIDLYTGEFLGNLYAEVHPGLPYYQEYEGVSIFEFGSEKDCYFGNVHLLLHDDNKKGKRIRDHFFMKHYELPPVPLLVVKQANRDGDFLPDGFDKCPNIHSGDDLDDDCRPKGEDSCDDIWLPENDAARIDKDDDCILDYTPQINTDGIYETLRAHQWIPDKIKVVDNCSPAISKHNCSPASNYSKCSNHKQKNIDYFTEQTILSDQARKNNGLPAYLNYLKDWDEDDYRGNACDDKPVLRTTSVQYCLNPHIGLRQTSYDAKGDIPSAPSFHELTLPERRYWNPGTNLFCESEVPIISKSTHIKVGVDVDNNGQSGERGVSLWKCNCDPLDPEEDCTTCATNVLPGMPGSNYNGFEKSCRLGHTNCSKVLKKEEKDYIKSKAEYAVKFSEDDGRIRFAVDYSVEDMEDTTVNYPKLYVASNVMDAFTTFTSETYPLCKFFPYLDLGIWQKLGVGGTLLSEFLLDFGDPVINPGIEDEIGYRFIFDPRKQAGNYLPDVEGGYLDRASEGMAVAVFEIGYNQSSLNPALPSGKRSVFNFELPEFADGAFVYTHLLFGGRSETGKVHNQLHIGLETPLPGESYWYDLTATQTAVANADPNDEYIEPPALVDAMSFFERNLNQMVVLGGKLADGEDNTACYLFDLETVSWRRLDDLPVDIDEAMLSLREDHGELWLMGGKENPSSIAYILDFTTGEWSDVSAAFSRAGASAIYDRYGDRFLVFGGREISGKDGTPVSTNSLLAFYPEKAGSRGAVEILIPPAAGSEPTFTHKTPLMYDHFTGKVLVTQPDSSRPGSSVMMGYDLGNKAGGWYFVDDMLHFTIDYPEVDGDVDGDAELPADGDEDEVVVDGDDQPPCEGCECQQNSGCDADKLIKKAYAGGNVAKQKNTDMRPLAFMLVFILPLTALIMLYRRSRKHVI